MLLLHVLKIKNIATYQKIITPAVKWVFLFSITISFCSFNVLKHPFFICVTDIKHDAKQHSLNISIKLFTNDIENALKKTTGKHIDLLNPKNKPEMEMELFNYIKKRFVLNNNQKPIILDFIGYEKEEDVIWVYLEGKKVNQPKTLKINTILLYDYLPQQTNIIHTEINGIKKNSKVANPESIIVFNF